MKSLLIFVIVCACISIAFCIQCYDCESQTDPSCNIFFDQDRAPQTDCDLVSMPEYLHKYERRMKATGCLTKVHEGFEKDPYYIRRSCYFGDPEDKQEACDAIDTFVPWAKLISCSVCTEDQCNVHALNATHPIIRVWRKLTLVGFTLTVMALPHIHTLF